MDSCSVESLTWLALTQLPCRMQLCGVSATDAATPLAGVCGVCGVCGVLGVLVVLGDDSLLLLLLLEVPLLLMSLPPFNWRDCMMGDGRRSMEDRRLVLVTIFRRCGGCPSIA